MDTQESFTRVQTVPLANALLEGQSLRLCIDGGRRSQKEGAIGFALYSVECRLGKTAYKLFVRQGKVLADVDSAFLAEAAALECSLQCLVKLFKGKFAATKPQ